MPTHTTQIKYSHGSESHTKTVSKTASQEINIEETIPDSSTDLEVAISLDVSAIKSLLISSDQAITIETNSGSTPSDTLTPSADEPVIWWDGSEFSNPLTTDITTNIFVTNSSGSAATLVIKVLLDATRNAE